MAVSHRPSQPSSRKRKTLRVLFSCVGRRVELVSAFRAAGESLGIRVICYGTDVGWTAPAIHHVDHAIIAPRISETGYIHFMLRLVKQERIDLIVPTIDTDLLKLAEAKADFKALGCAVLVSEPEVIKICQDKLLTYGSLSVAGISTPTTWTLSEAMKLKKKPIPAFVKPRFGSAGMGTARVDHLDELKVRCRKVRNPIIQTLAKGIEHTLDVYCSLADGAVRCVVPRRRLEVKGGEVSKAQVVKDKRLMELGRRVVEHLGDCVGVVTVQMMRPERGAIQVIEINARFGGGAPLSIAAGADFPKWILMEHLGQKPRIRFDGFKANLQMLRYDQSVFRIARGQ